MKAVTEYVIGNTAVKIVDTGRRIRVIDVEQQKERIHFAKTAIAVVVAAALSFITCLSVVNFQHSKTCLDRNIFTLKAEIETLERENKTLEKKVQERELPYNKIYKKAIAMGMDFPKNDHVKQYTYKKGSGIHLYHAPTGQTS